MIHLLGRIPKGHFHVACSGGSDSMVLIDFLLRQPKNKFDVLHFNHGTEYCDEAEEFITKFCLEHNLKLHVGRITEQYKKGESREDYWRRNRYAFLSKFKTEPILMAHHLNDVIETWFMGLLTGTPRLIPYHNPITNVYRPLLITPKSEINDWSMRHHVDNVIDGSNFDTSIKRNYIRHKMMEHIYEISPGIEKIIKKKILTAFK